MSEIRLDTPAACREELERVSNGMVELTTEYTRKRERLGWLEAHLDLLRAQTLVRAEGSNKEEREAKVLIALANTEETKGLLAEEAQLQTELEVLSQRLRTLEKRGGHAQSANKSHDQERSYAGTTPGPFNL
jgi:hypothetical protein